MEEELIIFHYPSCSTCKKALKWLKDHSITYKANNIVEVTPSKEDLKKWKNYSGLQYLKFFNTAGKVYKEKNLKEKVKIVSEEELLDLLSSDGMLIKRPLLIKGNLVLIGFKEEEWKGKLMDN